MPKKVYGVNAWSKLFLSRLHSMGGRIERGEAIARTNKIYDVKLSGPSIQAKVVGNSAPYYHVSARWEPLSDEQRTKLDEVIRNDPGLLASILAGELPEALFTRLSDVGVQLLPSSFQELHGDCDCPDNRGGGSHSGYWAYASVKGAKDPCKHQAALFFQMVDLLDQNPSELFRWRGADLTEMFGFRKQGVTELRYPFPLDALSSSALSSSAAADLPPLHLKAEALVALPSLSDARELILSCLPPKPPFNVGKLDYAAVFAEFYGFLDVRNRKFAASLEAATLPWMANLESQSTVALARAVSGAHRISLLLSPTFSPDATVVLGDAPWSSWTEAEVASLFSAVPHRLESSPENDKNGVVVLLSLSVFRGLLAALGGDPNLPRAGYSAAFVFWEAVSRFTAAVVSARLVLPAVVPVASNSFRVVWRPLTAGQSGAAEALQLLTQAASRVEAACPPVRMDQTPLAARAAALHASVALLTNFLHSLNWMHKGGGAHKPPLSDAFFKGTVWTAPGLAAQGTGVALQNWLGVFDLLATNLQLLFRLTESTLYPNHYQLSLLLAEKKMQCTDDQKISVKSEEKDEEKKKKKVVHSFNFKSPRIFVQENPEWAGEALRLLGQLKTFVPEIADCLQSEEGHVQVAEAAFEAFILRTLGVLSALGVQVQLPGGRQHIFRPRIVRRARLRQDSVTTGDERGAKLRTYLHLRDLLQFDVEVAVGEHVLTLQDMESMQASGRVLVEFKDGYVVCDPLEVAQLLKEAQAAAREPPPSPLQLVRERLSGSARVTLTPEVAELVDSMLAVRHFEPSANVCATLRDYQAIGVNWLLSNLHNVGGCLLADDMGLGKTLQTIAALQRLVDDGDCSPEKPCLVVAPMAVMTNWKRELERFAPSIRVAEYYGRGRTLLLKSFSKKKPGKNGGKKRPGPQNSPSSTRKKAAIQSSLTQTQVPTTSTRRVAAKNAPKEEEEKEEETEDVNSTANPMSPYHIYLTTYDMMCTEIDELSQVPWSVIILDEAQAIKNAKTTRSKTAKLLSFVADYRIALTGTPVENSLSEMYSIFEFVLPGFLADSWEDFRKKFAKPIEVERNAETVRQLSFLTGPFMMRRLKTDPRIAASLPEKVIDTIYPRLTNLQADLYEKKVDKVMTEREMGTSQKGDVLSLITYLKKLCNHPSLVEDSLQDMPNLDQLSGKLTVLLECLEPVLQLGNDKIIVFSQYVESLKLVRRVVRSRFALEPLMYDGSMLKKSRDDVLDNFARDPACPLLLMSLRAGGVGLNLTCANHVFLFDMWWNEAVENQAIDRLFRIGQNKTVFVHRFVVKDSFEEKIKAMIEKKASLFDMTVQEGEKFLADLSQDELRNLFKLEKSD